MAKMKKLLASQRIGSEADSTGNNGAGTNLKRRIKKITSDSYAAGEIFAGEPGRGLASPRSDEGDFSSKRFSRRSYPAKAPGKKIGNEGHVKKKWYFWMGEWGGVESFQGLFKRGVIKSRRGWDCLEGGGQGSLAIIIRGAAMKN